MLLVRHDSGVYAAITFQGTGERLSIIVRNLRKTYGNVAAVSDLSFAVESGSLFAFLGSNGAGKSTTIGCLTTVLTPSGGSAAVDGFDVVTQADAVRKRVGVVFQQSLLDPLLTVEENIRSRAGFYGISGIRATQRIDELSSLVGLESFLGRRYGQLSGGQKRRADIARAIVHRPQVIFLDEPTAGLDPQSREQIWAAMHGLREQQGVTVFLTTHYMEETERADNVCIIDKGEMVAEGTPATLRATYSSSILTVRGRARSSILDQLDAMGIDTRLSGDDVIVPVESSAAALRILHAVPVDDFEFRHGTMDDVFLAVTEEVRA